MDYNLRAKKHCISAMIENLMNIFVEKKTYTRSLKLSKFYTAVYLLSTNYSVIYLHENVSFEIR